MLFYQIKGLRKKEIVELNEKARGKKAISSLLTHFKEDINQLEGRWSELNTLVTKMRSFETARSKHGVASSVSSRIKSKI